MATKQGSAQKKPAKQRCWWVSDDPIYIAYHDEEWGVPLKGDDQRLHEFLLLETFQAGLSWITVLFGERDSSRS